MKEVAKSLTEILDNQTVKSILDKSSDLNRVIAEVTNYWSYDLYKRNPGPAYLDAEFIGTDLDLACFLYSLSDRNAVIVLPTYHNLRPATFKECEHIVSKDNRHGQILGLTSNKDNFIFCVKIKDANVVTSDKVGSYRNFAITDFNGDWYNGWDSIEFIPTAKENDWITNKELWSDNKIIFKNFVHPARWTSFFGKYYLITKLLINRLKEENRHIIRDLIGRLKVEFNLKLPPDNKDLNFNSNIKKEYGKKIKIDAFEVEIDIPESNSKFPELSFLGFNEEILKNFQNKLKFYNQIISNLQFMTRVTELALYNKMILTGYDPLPSWITNASWEKNYKKSGKRTVWDRLVLFQPKVDQRGVAIRKRVWKKTEEVSLNYEV